MVDPSKVLREYKPNTEISQLSQRDFEQRLGLLLNSYWQAGFGVTFQAGDNEQTLDVTTVPIFNTTVTLQSGPTMIYELSIPWVVTLFVSSVVLLLAGLASAWWEHHTIGPDILGFASSIVRQSKYVSVPKGPSGESGAARAQRLKDHKVMMQDVRPSGPVGKIVLGSALETSVPLDPGKMYR